MSPPHYVHVALPLPLDQLFTYRIPESMTDQLQPGMRVVVPFQHQFQTGYTVSLESECDLEKIRDVEAVLDANPIIRPDMMKLCTWIAQYYCCSLGEALHCTVPAGLSVRTSKEYSLLTNNLTAGRFTDAQRELVAMFHSRGTMSEVAVKKAIDSPTLKKDLQSLVRRSLLQATTVIHEERITVQYDTWLTLVSEAYLSAKQLVALQRKASKQAAVYLEILRSSGEALAKDVYQKHGASSATARTMEKKGLIQIEKREYYRDPLFNTLPAQAEKFTLNPEQQHAYNAMIKPIAEEAFSTFLLQGITGSGKTEVYLQVMEFTLAQGRSAIMLVPEISLTPQTVGRLMARFDNHIAVLHSGLSAGERFDEWRRVQRGEVQIVVGGRSAVFAPLPSLGLIVVDEEHDNSYKQSDTPRYHARDVAIVRAQTNHAVCILGSATPSIESYQNSETGKSIRIELLQRATSGSLPKVEIVDMRAESAEHGGELVLSKMLETAILQRLENYEQTILLLNRRGHSPFVLCPQCGWSAECDHCNVTLTYHAKGQYLACHYCDARHEVPVVCGQCHFNPLIYLGAGTQKIEDYLQRSYPDARIARMDRDTTSTKGSHAEILKRFSDREIDILIGTQMIAKGHDYPAVTLVGVVNADTGLTLPDFRAAETGFQLLTQVAGRAGRGDKAGQVIIQTYRPKHFAIIHAANHDYAGFFANEIKFRESAAYPPFRRMMNLAIESENLIEAERSASHLHRVVRNQMDALGFTGMELLGPAPATIHRVRNRYRWNLGVLSKSSKRLNTLARQVRDEFGESSPANVLLKIDLDPYGMF
ncbi:MAG: primosomal protein N' [Candidatus Hydrogenedentota bacterium]